MNLHNGIINIRADDPEAVGYYGTYYLAYRYGHRDAKYSAAELSLKAQRRIEELEQALQRLYLTSGPVSNCAYNVGQQHEDWENISQYISVLDQARMEALKVYQGKNK